MIVRWKLFLDLHSIHVVTLQLLREWPPGYGGVERVAHELASVWRGSVFSLDVQKVSTLDLDPLFVNYQRRRILSIRIFGRFFLPLPCKPLIDLLFSSRPLHGHLPSPGVLIILLVALLLQPNRRITVHWHCFLETSSGLDSILLRLYQRFALFLIPHFSSVFTTSPLLADELLNFGCLPERLIVLPCSLSENQESTYLSLPSLKLETRATLRVLFIGRLDSYKRLDILLHALSTLRSSWTLSVVGDGTKRIFFEQLTYDLFGQPETSDEYPVKYLGRLSEHDKLLCLRESDLLVLPSDRCNEAFGIVQLEAMAAGRPSLAFNLPRTGMGWVCQLPGLSWNQSPQGLSAVLQQLADDPHLLNTLSQQSRARYLELFSRSVWLRLAKRFGDDCTQ